MSGPIEGGACQGLPPAVADLWFSESAAEQRLAKWCCAHCPVAVACRQAAQARGEKWGIWGGKNFDQRAQARARAKAAA